MTLLIYAFIGTGIYTFKVHGQIYHKLEQLISGKTAHVICSCTFMERMRPYQTGVKDLHNLMQI